MDYFAKRWEGVGIMEWSDLDLQKLKRIDLCCRKCGKVNIKIPEEACEGFLEFVKDNKIKLRDLQSND